MSLSIDDLVSSFSSSHIGQEANDLAALQAQLAEALFGASSSLFQNASFSQRGSDGHQQCTTPIARTSLSPGFNIDAGYRSRSSSISSRGPSGYEDAEDEMMVEELLIPASSSSQRTPSVSSHYKTPSMSMNYDPLPSPQSQSSHFASTDPFYLQAQANAQSYFYDNSNITQHGRPSVSSPFVAAAATQFHGYQYHPSMMSAVS